MTAVGGVSKRIGRYEVGALLATGGMASVHIGRAVGADALRRPLAIKHLHPTYARSTEFVQGLVDEAGILAQVQHPNVVHALEVVRLGEEVYVVLEYVRGDSLSALMGGSEARRALPPAIAIAIAIDVLDGIHAAHEARGPDGRPLGVVHRDVSPQNVVVGADGHARVIDFGVAKAQHRLQATRPGVVKGKLEYMAPEQLEAGLVDRRADIFAVGVVLWEMLTGRRLFAGESDGATMMRLLTCSVPPPSEAASDVSPALDAAVLRATRAEPEDRFATAEDMLAALEAAGARASPRVVGAWVQQNAKERLASRDALVTAMFAAPSQPDEVAAPAPARPDAVATEPTLVPSSHTNQRPQPARRLRTNALAAAALVAAGGLAYALWAAQAPGRSASPPTGAGAPSPTPTGAVVQSAPQVVSNSPMAPSNGERPEASSQPFLCPGDVCAPVVGMDPARMSTAAFGAMEQFARQHLSEARCHQIIATEVQDDGTVNTRSGHLAATFVAGSRMLAISAHKGQLIGKFMAAPPTVQGGEVPRCTSANVVKAATDNGLPPARPGAIRNLSFDCERRAWVVSAVGTVQSVVVVNDSTCKPPPR
ncbi:MAG: serine/threonine protein kinase [Myxococcales bacterium]|nr:serine/threonine protein kinase [Myxococcales bacterium]